MISKNLKTKKKMSFPFKLASLVDLCYEVPKKFNPHLMGIVGFGVGCHLAYAYGTHTKDQTITVESKYQIFSQTQTHFAITANGNKQYLIPYSVWFWQFDVPEIWNSLEIGKTYSVSTYGYRVPALGLFTNVIKKD